MYSSYSLSKRLILIYFLAIQLLIRNILSLNLTNEYLNHKCRIYKTGSKYEENLKDLIRELSTSKFEGGFESIDSDEPPNVVSIKFGCRGDSYGSNCRSCFNTAVAGFRRRCKKNNGGMIWYDQCFLDISNRRRLVRDTDYDNIFTMHNSKNMIGDIKAFNKKTKDFLHKLTLEANRIPNKNEEFINYASGETKVGTGKLYAMVQCGKDVLDCNHCLEWNIRQLSKCCDGKRGARIVSTTCSLRYELYPFLRPQKTV